MQQPKNNGAGQASEGTLNKVCSLYFCLGPLPTWHEDMVLLQGQKNWGRSAGIDITNLYLYLLLLLRFPSCFSECRYFSLLWPQLRNFHGAVLLEVERAWVWYGMDGIQVFPPPLLYFPKRIQRNSCQDGRRCSYGQAKGLCPGKLLSDHMQHNHIGVIPVLMDRGSFIAPSWGLVRTDD